MSIQSPPTLTSKSQSTVLTVFFALILDLLAFTIPLPLFPRLIAWYLSRESNDPTTLLAHCLRFAQYWRQSLAPGLKVGQNEGDQGKNWDVVLLGGGMGSLFSLCQCVTSPWLGSLSDRYGRKPILLLTMLGNILSAIIWLYSTSFSSYLLSRTVGGLSEGNIQLTTAIISDVTTPLARSKSLALVGIAFSICFTLGPILGAYFASRSLPSLENLNIYAVPAALTLVLLILETAYLALRLPETRWTVKEKTEEDQKESEDKPLKPRESANKRLERLRALGMLHGLFLLFFSGAEFTLTFLTYDLFKATNAQNGRMLSFIGVFSALLQARHVRPSLSSIGEVKLARRGILSCIIGLTILAALPLPLIRSNAPTMALYLAATALSYTSATVVTGLTAAAGGCCDEEGIEESPKLQRGRALGGFRSKGQLGRAIGPLLATSIYWFQGPTVAYSTIASALTAVYLLTSSIQ